MGSYPASSFPSHFIDINGLGNHAYGVGLTEHNGIIYTASGGHIDIAHLRIAADNTRWLYNKSKYHLLNSDKDFYFKLNVEPSQYHVTLEYPDYWKNLPKESREIIADKVSCEMGQYFTFTMTTWHEVLTWFGFKCLFFLPEKASAFSWEDIYSNLLGTRLGATAAEDKQHGYNQAMTILLKNEMQKLEAQPIQTARLAAKMVKKKSFDGQQNLDMTRSTDIGQYDGYVTPFVLPGVCEYAPVKSYPVPSLKFFNAYGFSMNLEIEPKEFESAKIMKILYPDGSGKRVYPDKHLPLIIRYIENDCAKQGFALTTAKKYAKVVSAK